MIPGILSIAARRFDVFVPINRIKPHTIHTGPRIGRIIILGITPASKGNAIGIGLADFTTRAVADAIDRESTYANALASGNPESARIPVVVDDTDTALRAALMTAGVEDWSTARIVRIHNTLNLTELFVSAPLRDEARSINSISTDNSQ